MPWSHCDAEVLDTQPCPRCGLKKEEWTVEVDRTRTIKVAARAPRATGTDWLELTLEDGAGHRVADAAYRLELPNGRVQEGRLDGGAVRIEGVPAGQCRLTLAGCTSANETHEGRPVLVGVAAGATSVGVKLATGAAHRLLLRLPAPLVGHAWQEWHQEAPKVREGPDEDDQRAVDAVKPTLHLCFHERALATLDVGAGAEGKFLRWWIADAQGAVVVEHPWYGAEAARAGEDRAALSTGAHGWCWDGRKGDAFCPAGTYTSEVEVLDGAGAVVARDARRIELEGAPYEVLVLGVPKSDAELLAMGKAHGWLNRRGHRFGRDCWIKVHRGATDPGHVVFLGHGAIEATAWEPVNYGAVATPGGRTLMGFRRVRTWGSARRAVIATQDLGDGSFQIALEPNPGGPRPANPYGGDEPVKTHVQAHPGPRFWNHNGASIGCTTISYDRSHPVAETDGVRCDDPSFGTASSATEWDAFENKQVGGEPAQAARRDDHARPLLEAGVQPLHMQSTCQDGAFAGFLPREIPTWRSGKPSFALEPEGQVKLRVRLERGAPGSVYTAYHRAFAFGHDRLGRDEGGWKLQVWVPVTVQRRWNANLRNVRVVGSEVAWLILRRPPGGGPDEVAHVFWGTEDGGCKRMKAAALLGRTERTWEGDARPGSYTSVLRYRLRLLPVGGDDHVWTPDPAREDPMSRLGAQLAAERATPDGRWLEGESVLVLPPS